MSCGTNLSHWQAIKKDRVIVYWKSIQWPFCMGNKCENHISK